MKLTIHNKEVEFKWSFKIDLIFEQIQNHSFKGDNETDWIIHFYAAYLCCSNDFETDLETFISYLDEEPANFYAYIAWYSKLMTAQMSLIPKDEKQDSKKKVNKKTKQKKQ